MRVLVVATDHPPHREGGYELKCARFVDRAREAGHAVRVLTSARDGGAPDLDPEVRRDLTRFPADPRPCPPGLAAAAERRNAAALAYHLAAFEPNVVSWWRLGELSMSLPARCPVPGVGVVGDPWMVEGPRRDPFHRGQGRPPRFPGRWLFVSHALRASAQETGIALPDTDVVPEGVELERFPPVPPRPWGGRLLYAGRLSALKGVQDAVAAMDELEGCVLTVAGEGPHPVAGSDRVRIVGPMPHERVGALMADHDAVLFPSRWAEPSGRVPLEAMAVGRPVIATGTGGSGERLRDGENALLVPPGDPAAIAAAVRRLAGDAGLRERLAAAGRATAEAVPEAAVSARLLDELAAAVHGARAATL